MLNLAYSLSPTDWNDIEMYYIYPFFAAITEFPEHDSETASISAYVQVKARLILCNQQFLYRHTSSTTKKARFYAH